MNYFEFKSKISHSLRWLAEPLEDLPSFVEKRMFGCLAIYCHGRLMMLLAEGQEPWNGLLVPTEREFQAGIIKEFPKLKSHPVLGKWLYISQDEDAFEGVAQAVVPMILRDDPRFGVIGQKKTKKRGSRPGKLVKSRKRAKKA